MRPPEPETLPEDRLEQNVEVAMLCAFYGGLLTDRQRTALELRYHEDLSLGEIAEQFNVTRQNVHDLISRSAERLYHYEEAIGGVAQAKRVSARLRKALADLETAKSLANSPAYSHIDEATKQLTQIMMEIDGEETDTHGI